MRIQLKTLAVLPFLMVACGPGVEGIANGEDPITSLGSSTRSSRFGEQYWRREFRSNSTVWTEAMEYCKAPEKANFPNCEIVREVKFIGLGAPIKNAAESTEGFNL